MSNQRSGESGYQKKLRDPRWQRRRLGVLSEANWKCQDATCNKSDASLQVHHLYYEWGKEPWDYPPDAFLALCESCHERRGKIERALKISMVRALRSVPICRLETVAWRVISEGLKEAISTE